MRKSIPRFRRSLRTLYVGLAWLVTGVLPNHLSCSRIVQDSVANGTGAFLTNSTTDLLNMIFRPDAEGDGATDGAGTDTGDPFEPPVQT